MNYMGMHCWPNDNRDEEIWGSIAKVKQLFLEKIYIMKLLENPAYWKEISKY